MKHTRNTTLLTLLLTGMGLIMLDACALQHPPQHLPQPRPQASEGSEDPRTGRPNSRARDAGQDPYYSSGRYENNTY
jgi:hypothetical protein